MTTNDARNLKTVAITAAIVGWPTALLMLVADGEAIAAGAARAAAATIGGTLWHAWMMLDAVASLFV